MTVHVCAFEWGGRKAKQYTTQPLIIYEYSYNNNPMFNTPQPEILVNYIHKAVTS